MAVRVRHCPGCGAARSCDFRHPTLGVSEAPCSKGFAIFRGGQRASDQKSPAPVVPKRDRTLEQVIAHQRIAVLFQPQIDPLNGAIVGAEALVRWDGAGSPEALFARAASAGLAERLSRMIQRKALGIAATWEGALKGLHLSINLLRALRGRLHKWCSTRFRRRLDPADHGRIPKAHVPTDAIATRLAV